MLNVLNPGLPTYSHAPAADTLPARVNRNEKARATIARRRDVVENLMKRGMGYPFRMRTEQESIVRLSLVTSCLSVLDFEDACSALGSARGASHRRILFPATETPTECRGPQKRASRRWLCFAAMLAMETLCRRVSDATGTNGRGLDEILKAWVLYSKGL